MSLDLPQLTAQIEAAGRSAAERARLRQQLLPQAQAALQQVASSPRSELESRIQRAGGRWAGAVPTSEDPAARIDPPTTVPEGYQVIATDGSQIYPDRHAGALYYLINIGGIHLRHGSGEAPTTLSQPRLFYEAQDLFDDQGQLIPSEWINGRRDVAEIAGLAQLAADGAGEPTLALLDNGLLLWILLQGRDHRQGMAAELLAQYLAELTKLREAEAAIAGVVERPRSRSVLSLAHLAEIPPERVNTDTIQRNPYLSLSDHTLFSEQLDVGQRSALFVHGTPVNESYRQHGHEVHFFYLKSAPDTLLRVEVPAWVASQPTSLALVHVGLLAEGRATGGYPYTLARAHELAVVTRAEREQLEQQLARLMLAQGLTPRVSQKSWLKRWQGGRRRHRV